VRRA
jgi:hypothetical protein